MVNSAILEVFEVVVEALNKGRFYFFEDSQFIIKNFLFPRNIIEIFREEEKLTKLGLLIENLERFP